ncbi:MAG: gamma-glutamyltransferase family protein [Hyphomicrobiaceae bacterium]
MTHGMVSAAQPEAVEAGIETLKDGGNAVDAVVAAALVQTAVDPQMCGIAGFGCLHVYDPNKGIHECLDFHGRAPLAVKPDMWEHLLIAESEDGFGFHLEGRVNETGYQAITTPMTIGALDVALQRYGSRKLADLMDAAIDYAENGFMIRPHVAAYWSQVPTEGRAPHSDMLTRLPATRKIYARDDGSLRRVGEILKNPDMARTLRRIKADGIAAFYTGAIAAEILADMKAHDGLLTADDLAAAKPDVSNVLWGSYRGKRIATNPPPGGGIMVLEMLNILENFGLKAMGHNSPDYIATVAEAMKIATVDKDNKIGDPRFIDVPVDELISKIYAAPLAARIRSGEKTHVPRAKGRSKESPDTTPVLAVDENGVIATMTHTLGTASGVVSDGLGFMYNGAMAVFDPRPGRTGSLAPGKSRFSSLAPTIIFDGDTPILALGAPGGTYIAMGLLQTILNVLEFDMTAQEAVSAPRFNATSDTLDITNRIFRSTEAELKRRGYPVRRWPMNFHFAGVHAIRIRNGKLDGGADPGRDGMAMAI